MAPIVLVVLIGLVVFVVGLATRRSTLALIGTPAAMLFLFWIFSASSRPNPKKEFDRLFGASNRAVASEIRTIKPVLMDGHFISFRMRPSHFAHVRSLFSEVELASPPNILLGQSLPAGWPAAVKTSTSVLHREVEHQDVYLLYFPQEEIAYASVRYDRW